MISSTLARTANLICSSITLFILSARIGLSLWKQKGRLDASVLVCALAITWAIARMIVAQLIFRLFIIHVSRYEETVPLEHVKETRQLSLVARVCSTSFYWLQMCLLLLFYRPILSHIAWVAIIIWVCWVLLGVTYIAVILATFIECRPFRLYWNVNPSAACADALIQWLTQGISNVVIELLILISSAPMLNWRQKTRSQILRVWTLFAIGVVCIATNCVRISIVAGTADQQASRSFWGSIQEVTATTVANVPTIYGCWRVLRQQSQSRVFIINSTEEP
ncbi:hypothetical protein BO99DRAFT_254106 [Aspergillus violaceofuscus CBS 115571]|uniref:Rhodopsin domain-containing protein n=1 Tax=Aspergillus violaceofuscus (strain CBS 115571) TaxID=1450538 RepID=A0A2V5GW43_ASPV1|nr:hypothetical protein BO99DRAFT_254106 [Aspergillus violaceofuscus CBS 115571]